MAGESTPDDRPSLNISVVGEGISPEDVPIEELGSLLKATAALLRAVANEQRVTAPEVALVRVTHGSAAYAFRATDPVSDRVFAPIVDGAHRAIRVRGSGYSRPVRTALERLYGACTRGPLQVAGRALDGSSFDAVTMAAPLQSEPLSVDATTTLHGKIVSVVCARTGYELTLKPRDGSARVELYTEDDELAERSASQFNQNVKLYAQFSVGPDGKRNAWRLLNVSRYEPRSFLDVLDEIRDELTLEGVDIDADRFRRALTGEAEPRDA